MMLVATANSTGTIISRAPSTAAWSLGAPRSMAWYTFSPTMTASSTTMPSVMMNANSEIMLMLAPNSGSSSSAPMSVVGMPKATQKASRGWMNRPSTITTSSRPQAPLLTSSASRSRYCSPRSRSTATPQPSGSAARSPSRYPSTASAMASGFSSPDWYTVMKMPRPPSNQFSMGRSWKPSTSRATSPTRTLLPSAVDTSTMSA